MARFKHTIFAAALLIAPALSGCVNGPTGGLSLAPNVQDSLNKIGDFTIADLKNADAIAIANNDTIGSQCYEGLITFVQGQQAAVNGAAQQTVSGAFSAFEAGRAGLTAANSATSAAVLKPLEQACGPLVVDVQNQPAVFLANLAALGVKP